MAGGEAVRRVGGDDLDLVDLTRGEGLRLLVGAVGAAADDVVLDLGGLGPADLAVGPSALSELMASLHVLAEPEHHPEAAAWTARAATADPGLYDELSVFAPPCGPATAAVCSFPAGCRRRRTWRRN